VANRGDVALKAVNLVMTGAAVLLVERKGRRFLLLAGSGGASAALALAGGLFLAAQTGAMAPDLLHGWLVAGCLGVFMAAFAVGPGVCAWLALSELMPARIRANGMAVALLLNQLVAAAIAAVFLPAVAAHGYAAMFFAWAGCAAAYFLIVLLFLPETRGRTLEQIEAAFGYHCVGTARSLRSLSVPPHPSRPASPPAGSPRRTGSAPPAAPGTPTGGPHGPGPR
jgi:MFS family permease